MKMKDFKELVIKFNKLTTFKEQLDFLKKNNDIFQVVLDNDCQHIQIKSDTKIEDVTFESDKYYEFIDELEINDFIGIDYFGWNDGVVELFKYIGIDAEPC